MQILFSILTVLFIVVSIALVLIVLVQRPQGGGLTGAFGGGAGADTAFGGRTGDALTVATITAFVVYLLLAIGLNITSNKLREAPAPSDVVPVADQSVPAADPATTPATEGAATEGTAATPPDSAPLVPVPQQPVEVNPDATATPAATPAPVTPPAGG